MSFRKGDFGNGLQGGSVADRVLIGAPIYREEGFFRCHFRHARRLEKVCRVATSQSCDAGKCAQLRAFRLVGRLGICLPYRKGEVVLLPIDRKLHMPDAQGKIARDRGKAVCKI